MNILPRKKTDCIGIKVKNLSMEEAEITAIVNTSSKKNTYFEVTFYDGTTKIVGRPQLLKGRFKKEILNTNDDEVWKIVPNTNNKYMASSEGRVKNCDNNIEIVGSRNKDGYIVVSKSESLPYVFKHRMIMAAFHGDSDLVVDHINRIRDDNRLCNLRYVTMKENSLNTKLNYVYDVYDIKNDILYKDITIFDDFCNTHSLNLKLLHRTCEDGDRAHHKGFKITKKERRNIAE